MGSLTRRAILAAAALLPLVPGFGPASRGIAKKGFDPSATIILDYVGLHADVAAHHASLRAQTYWLKPDLSQLYFHQLAPRWLAHGVRPLIGFTRAAPADRKSVV